MKDVQRFDASVGEILKPCHENLAEKSYLEVLKELDNIESGKGIGNILTGISAVDNVLQGVCPGMMDVYAAEAGSGKTSLIEMISIKFLLQGHPVLLFQRDMTPFLFYMRLACRMADVGVSELRRMGHINTHDVQKVRECAATLKKTPISLYSPDGCTGKDVKDITEREVGEKGTKVVIIDHIRTLRHSKTTSWDGIEENSGYIRDSTNKTGVAHIVLAHVNREGAKAERPTLSHIKGGDQLKDDSDNCCVMWLPEGRPERHSHEQKWKVSFGFDKTRWDWGGVETMNYNGPKMAFEKIGPDWVK